MALVTLRQMLDHAAENSYGVPAFNVNNLEQMRAIMEAADETDSPVIMQASAGARKYAGDPFLRHLDAGRDRGVATDSRRACTRITVRALAVCQRSIQLGFSSGDDGRLAEGRWQDSGDPTNTTSM